MSRQETDGHPPITAHREKLEVGSLFQNILWGCACIAFLLVPLVATELASRTIGPFGSGVYRFVFCALLVAAAITVMRIPDPPGHDRDGGRPVVKTPDLLQRGYRRLYRWLGDTGHPIRQFFWGALSVLVLSMVTKTVSSLGIIDLSEPFWEILVHGLVATGLAVGMLLLLSLIAGLLPGKASEEET